MADARQLDVPSNSIDYIFTDPPYADAVQYGELNFVWESWLGGTPDWHSDEIVVNRRGARMPIIGHAPCKRRWANAIACSSRAAG